MKKNEGKNEVWSIDKTLVGMEDPVGAVIRRCSVHKVLRKIAQNSQENACVGVPL